MLRLGRKESSFQPVRSFDYIITLMVRMPLFPSNNAAFMDCGAFRDFRTYWQLFQG